jgi:hypothetical protein
MRFLKTFFALAVLLASPLSAAADGLPVVPGLWEVSWAMPDPLGGDPVRQSQRTCVRERTITTDRVNAQMTQCRVWNAVFKESSARWKMRCDTPAGPITGTGSLRSNGSAVSGSVDMAFAIGSLEVPVTGQFKGRRVGDCH